MPYKRAIATFLILNPVVFVLAGPFVAGWLLIVEFIFTLAMALRCYPLQPGGGLAIEAVAIGTASPDAVVLLSLVFCLVSALLSAFLDALTVIAVVIAVATGLYAIYHRAASGRAEHEPHTDEDDSDVLADRRDELGSFRTFLRNLVMHAAIGTALGGALTIVGEPQNLLIGQAAGWLFVAFFPHMAPVTLPVLGAGLLVCVVLERFCPSVMAVHCRTPCARFSRSTRSASTTNEPQRSVPSSSFRRSSRFFCSIEVGAGGVRQRGRRGQCCGLA